jgi:hypothetical protein
VSASELPARRAARLTASGARGYERPLLYLRIYA